MRARLIIGVVALAFLGLLVAGGATYAELRSSLLERVDQQADAALPVVTGALEDKGAIARGAGRARGRAGAAGRGSGRESRAVPAAPAARTTAPATVAGPTSACRRRSTARRATRAARSSGV